MFTLDIRYPHHREYCRLYGWDNVKRSVRLAWLVDDFSVTYGVRVDRAVAIHNRVIKEGIVLS